MRIRIERGTASGTLAAPPSKSMSHRLLICAGLSGGPCRVEGILPSDDLLATQACLCAAGTDCLLEDGRAVLRRAGDTLPPEGPVSCHESGSTLRFFIPLFLLGDQPVNLSGSPRLMDRPLTPYEKICAERDLEFSLSGTSLRVRGPLMPGRFSLQGDISSQFVSGLLFALPLLSGDSIITLTGGVSSRAYIDMTRQAQAMYGIQSEWIDDHTLGVPGRQRYRPADTTVEGDWSNAAYLEGLNLLGGSVTVTGLEPDSLQGDRIFRDYYSLLKSGFSSLDVDQCPDLAPVLMALAAANQGVRLTGTRRLRLKESDRGAAMAAELRKLNVDCRIEENSITVPGGPLAPSPEPLSGHNDHRIVMALSLLLTVTGGVRDGAKAVSKSWPAFFSSLRQLRIRAEELL